jgi:hypothetical protein
MTTHAAQELADDCLRLTRHQPHQALEWLVDDVLADFGIKPATAPPEDMHEWLFDHSGLYARAVIANPFKDVLGQTYETIASRGRRACLGQFFTPDPVAQLMGAVLIGNDPRHARAREDDRLWTVCEPTCGSGALLLGFLDNLIQAHGPAALRHWSVTGIDLDALCARMCAAQLLCNVFLHVSNAPQGSQRAQEPIGSPESPESAESAESVDTQERPGLGELVIYCGNSLGPLERLRVVVHATRRDLGADLVLPALHPHRVAMLRQAQRQAQVEATQSPERDSDAAWQASAGTKASRARSRQRPSADTPSPASAHAAGSSPRQAAPVNANSATPPTADAATGQVDLFAD